jgi:hypothetical protein
MFVLCSLKIEAQTKRLSGLSLCRSPFILLWGNLIQTEPSIGASHQSLAHLAKQRIITCNERCINRVHLTFSLYANCQNRPCRKEFNTTAFVNLLICNINVNIILWSLNIVFMKLFPQSDLLRYQRVQTKRLSGLSLCRSPLILLWGNLIQTEPSIGASHQSLAHLAKQFQRWRFF